MKPEQTRPEAEKPTIPMVEFALLYAQNNWPVFPLHGKLPYKESHGHKDATSDQNQIQTWWTQHPGANIGLATGEQSGVIVLDMDVPEGYFHLKELLKEYEPLPETRTSHTANGGLHYFFQHPQDGNTYHGTVGLHNLVGLDVRADGNYVVLPPSRLFGRKYYTWNNPTTPIAPIPDWLLAMLPKKDEAHHLYPQDVRFAGTPGEKWLSEALTKSTEGNRNAVGFWLACQLRDDQIPEQQARSLLLTYANLAPIGREQYTSKEAIASVTSAYKRPPREPARSI